MYSMKECCALTGLNYDTLKFYCNEGLIPNVKRDKNNNYRLFDDNDINWIKSLICLKKCNLSLNEMKRYIDLCLLGKKSVPERKEMLLFQKKVIESQIKELEETMKFIEKKTELYDKFLSGEVKYYSYLIKNKN